jgi:ketosteroid isomerase-like protein
MLEADVQRWLDRYVEAWRTYDPAAIGELFSEDAEYRYHPWDSGEQVVVGREAIVASWLDERDEPGSWTATYLPWLVAGDAAVAVGVSRYRGADRGAVEREYHNVFLCRFDADGRCREFTEHFMRRDSS